MHEGRLHPISIAIREIADIFGRMGFGIAEFGDRSFIVDALPPYLGGEAVPQLLRSLVDEMEGAGAGVKGCKIENDGAGAGAGGKASWIIAGGVKGWRIALVSAHPNVRKESVVKPAPNMKFFNHWVLVVVFIGGFF